MFGQLTHPKGIPRRRQAGAALMAVLLTSTLVGAGLLAGGQQVMEWPDQDDAPLVLQVMLEDAPLPAPPGPGAATQAPVQPEVQTLQPEVQPPETPEEPAPLDQDALAEVEPASVVSMPISNGLLDQGTGTGGTCDSPPCGPCQGPECGTSTKDAGGGPVQVRGLEPRHTVEPRYPQAAHELGLPSTRCLTRFTVDTKGRTVDVQLVSCPTAFREATLEAAWGWRFWPARVNGRAVDSTFVVGFTFTPR